MQKKFEVNRTKIKEGCQSETKESQLISNSQLPLGSTYKQSLVILGVTLSHSAQIEKTTDIYEGQSNMTPKCRRAANMKSLK